MIKEALSDDNKNISSIRLMSFIAELIAGYVTVVLMIHPEKITLYSLYVLCAWLVGAFAPKVIQKVIEKWADLKMGGGKDVGSGSEDNDNQ